jgi:Leu/Phe-tRNA-protein transferase
VRIDKDGFEEWKANYITEALIAFCRASNAHAVETWHQASIGGGKCDPIQLAEIRARISAFEEIINITREDLDGSNSK